MVITLLTLRNCCLGMIRMITEIFFNLHCSRTSRAFTSPRKTAQKFANRCDRLSRQRKFSKLIRWRRGPATAHPANLSGHDRIIHKHHWVRAKVHVVARRQGDFRVTFFHRHQKTPGAMIMSYQSSSESIWTLYILIKKNKQIALVFS